MDEPKPSREYSIMRWISFGVITILFAASAVRSILDGRDIDKIISGIFIVIIGTAWGANLWKTFIK
jgi:hypothetical protein